MVSTMVKMMSDAADAWGRRRKTETSEEDRIQ